MAVYSYQLNADDYSLYISLGTFVAFSAYLDHTLRNMGNDQIIVFNQIILNEGGGYDQETGVFTCPKSGLYLITFFIGKTLSPVDTRS